MTVRNSLAGGLQSFATALHMKPFQALIWFTCWSAWTIASLQFYLLPFTLSNIAKYLNVKQSRISEVNTYTMLSRSLGAVIFGVLSDQYGRKIPLLIDLVCLGVFSLCSGFIHTYSQLIGVRLLFGESPIFSGLQWIATDRRCRNCVWWCVWTYDGDGSRVRS